MYRRQLLAIAGIGLAGCLGRGGSGTGTPSPDSPSPLPLSVTLDSVYEPSSTDAVSVTAEVVEPSITSDHTATVSLVFENASNDPLDVSGGMDFPFSMTESEDQRWGLLYSADAATPKSPDCWEPKIGVDAFARPMNLVRYTLAPGERREAKRWLWSHPAAEVCMPTGVTTFRTDGTIDPKGEEQRIEWGFDVRISTG